MGKKLLRYVSIPQKDFFLLKTGPKSAEKREMEVNVALSLALRLGAVEGSLL